MEFYQTEKKFKNFIRTTVSIPNGMEFYPVQILNQMTRASFNSQRDGILLFIAVTVRTNTMFQFPTGWNSTFKISRSFMPRESFNSQRDGILLWTRELFITSAMFQFPTGWNSTQTLRGNYCKFFMFQFPTGWNSTLGKFDRWNEILSFNSQRDGILHR